MGEEGENEENKGTSLRFGTFAFRRYRLSFVLLLLFFFCNQISSRQIDRPFTFHVPHFSSHFSRFELGSIKWREMDLISILSSLILKPFKKLSIDFI